MASLEQDLSDSVRFVSSMAYIMPNFPVHGAGRVLKVVVCGSSQELLGRWAFHMKSRLVDLEKDHGKCVTDITRLDTRDPISVDGIGNIDLLVLIDPMSFSLKFAEDVLSHLVAKSRSWFCVMGMDSVVNVLDNDVSFVASSFLFRARRAGRRMVCVDLGIDICNVHRITYRSLGSFVLKPCDRDEKGSLTAAVAALSVPMRDQA